jgi:hypothetical protein
MRIWIFEGFLMRILLFLLAVVFGSGPAAAQTDMDDVRPFIEWTTQLSVFDRDIVGLLSASGPADEIGLAARSGEIDQASALAQMDEWRRQVDAELARLTTFKTRLAQGPLRYPADKAASVAAMIENLSGTFEAISGFLDLTEDATRRDIAGETVDDNLLSAARFGVLQQYYVSLMRTNQIAIDTGDQTHPQTHLLMAMNENMASTILVFEMARQDLGGARSSHHVRNTRRFFAARNRAIETALEQCQIYYQILRARLAVARPVLEAEQRMQRILIEMLDTYPASISVERAGAALLATARTRLDEADLIAIGIYFDEIGTYETDREALQIRRTELAGQL